MNKKQILVLILSLILMLSILVGCNNSDEETVSFDGTVNILCIDSPYSTNMISAIREKFPETNLNISYYLGSNPTDYIEQAVMNGEGPDIILSTEEFDESFQKEYLLDISGYGYSSKYTKSLVQNIKVDNTLYMVPGTYSYVTMFYNKSVFSSNGWSIPQTNADMATLISNIKAKSILPITLSAGDGESFYQLLAALSQAEYLTTIDGATWVEQYKEKDTSIGRSNYSQSSEGFDAGWTCLQAWGLTKAFTSDDLENDSAKAFTKLVNGQAAMAFVSGDVYELESILKTSNANIGTFAIAGSDSDKKIVPYQYNYFISTNKTVANDESKKHLVSEITKYLTSADGIAKISAGESDISPIKGSTSDWNVYDGVKNVVKAGYTAEQLTAGFEQIIPTANYFIKGVSFNNYSANLLTSRLDTAHKTYINNLKTGVGYEKLVTVKDNFTEAQTAQFVADMIQSSYNASLTLVSLGGIKDGVYNTSGVNGKLYKGDLNYSNYDTFLPGDGYGTIYLVSLTGKQIVEMINSGKTVTSGDTTVSFDYYWSGVKIKLDQYGKVYGIQFTSGTTIAFDTSDAQSYTVALVSNDFNSSVLSSNSQVFKTGATVKSTFENYINNASAKVTEISIPESSDRNRSQW